MTSAMRRSFSDRILGGVCGGLAVALHLDAWLVRIAFAALTVASLGVFAVLYILLWWIVPMESPVEGRRGLPVIFALILIVLAAASWYARDNGLLVASNGESIFWQGAAIVLALVFFLRQIR
jgi:phage shock protein PspC (stress-responsive transcriptional regulator)